MHKNYVLFLALVLFSIFGPRIHSQPLNISPIDLAALQQIKNCLIDIPSTSNSSLKFFSTWDFSSHDPCSSFAGITCSSIIPRHVLTLTLGTGLSDSLGLAGSLSSAICNLTELTQLVLYTGIVTGSIPNQLGSLNNLRVISLTNNRLTGTIPESIFKLPNLHTLDLSHNLLSGSIPSSISQMVQLKVLVLASNKLTGALPSNLPAGLFHLDMKNNGFSGILPKKLPVTLRYVSVSGNRLWGPLNGLESLSELVYLDLSMNRLSGPIPLSLFRSNLTSMLVQRNNLSGNIPPQKITSLSYPRNLYGPGSVVDLSHNMLAGEISGVFLGVETLFLNNNQFSGKVPKEYVRSILNGDMKTLYLQHNYLTDFPMESDLALPGSASLCLSYNCMVPQVGLDPCPASAGEQLSRPAYQCSKFNNGSSGD
ncbi:hypothetical protein M9H77_26925 [Catharanthus roseus]|uniref:Uncharacterized protein n=1 Tax=Catharanthus roseus TaxID=4058 RepID=A0ACC0ACG4_CATRO|nr:hypothetical protein M9H77_26925 [Catharanthus roseus]